MNHLPPKPPKNDVSVISNFFKNSQVKVHHCYQRHRWQIMGTIPDCWHLKVNFKRKQICLYVNSTTQRCEHFREFSKKIETVHTFTLHSGAWGKLILKKTWSRKSHGTVPLNNTHQHAVLAVNTTVKWDVKMDLVLNSTLLLQNTWKANLCQCLFFIGMLREYRQMG